MRFTSLLLLVALLSTANTLQAQTFLTIEPGTSITLQASTELTIDSLYLKPNLQTTLPGGTIITRSKVPVIANGFQTIAKHYHFSGSPIAFRGRIQISYRDNELNNISESSLRLNYHDGSSWKYFTSNYTSAPVDNYLTANTIDVVGLKEITLGTPSAVLPLTWGSISGECNGTVIRLNWETVQELNTSHFIIEKSINGREWQELGKKPAAGNSSTPRLYTLEDATASGSIVYYRIRIVDIDGSYSYSSVIPVQRCGTADKLNVYPIPARDMTSLYVHAQSAYASEMILTGSDGKILRKQKIAVQAGSNQFPVNLSGLSAGVYYLQVTTRTGDVQVVRISKQ